MQVDDDGFLFPVVDIDKCFNCGTCMDVCPVIKEPTPKTDLDECFVARTNQVDILKKSSSGGVFYELAMRVLGKEGAVFGAGWDCELCRHPAGTSPLCPQFQVYPNPLF